MIQETPISTIKVNPNQSDKFFTKSINILSETLEYISSIDENNILSGSRPLKFRYIGYSETYYQRKNKFMHLNSKQGIKILQVLFGNMRSINIVKTNFYGSKDMKVRKQKVKKTLLPSKYRVTFQEKDRIIELIGPFQYNKIMRTQLKNIQDLEIRVQSNFYIEFQEFYEDFETLINKKLFDILQGKLEDYQQLKNENLSRVKIWDIIGVKIFQIWNNFVEYLHSNEIQEKYENEMNKDLNKLFETLKDARVINGTRKHQLFNKRNINKNLIYTQKNSIHQINARQFKEVIFQFSPFQSLQEIRIDSQNTNFWFPFAQNYANTQAYLMDPPSNEEKKINILSSLKEPVPTCEAQCQCLYQMQNLPDDFYQQKTKCPNLRRNVQCNHHSCKNSQIRENKQVISFCLDLKKGSLKSIKQARQFLGNNQHQKYNCKYQVQQFYSYGLDWYTVKNILHLLPYLNEDDIDQEKHKYFFIQNLIPFQISKTQNLLAAVSKLKNYEKFKYYAEVLQKKLSYINKFRRTNINVTSYLTTMQGYFKGIGVRNIGKTIPKDKFITKFFGQILEPWRQQQRQFLSYKKDAQEKKHKKSSKSNFYCISVQSHLNDPQPLKVFSIDPQNKGNFSRSFNHSCNPNCKISVMISEGQYCLAIYALRDIQPKEQLTFDYNSVTDNYEDFFNAKCLCSSIQCRKNYLRYQQSLSVSLNKIFLKNQFSFQKQVDFLIKCSICIFPLSENIQQQKIKQVNQLKQFKVDVRDQIFQTQNYWLLNWIKNILQILYRELNFQVKESQDSQDLVKYVQSCKNFKELLGKLGQEENLGVNQKQYLESLCIDRLVQINKKLSKIYYILENTKSNLVPLRWATSEEMIRKTLTQKESLQSQIKPVKGIQKDYYNKSLIQDKINRLNIIQAQFFQGGENLEKAKQKLIELFTYESVFHIHEYPDFQGQSVKIWRERKCRINQKIYYDGKKLQLLGCLLDWGNFKKIGTEIENNNDADSNDVLQGLKNQLPDSRQKILRKLAKISNKYLNTQQIVQQINRSPIINFKRKSFWTKLKKHIEKIVKNPLQFLANQAKKQQAQAQKLRQMNNMQQQNVIVQCEKNRDQKTKKKDLKKKRSKKESIFSKNKDNDNDNNINDQAQQQVASSQSPNSVRFISRNLAKQRSSRINVSNQVLKNQQKQQ